MIKVCLVCGSKQQQCQLERMGNGKPGQCDLCLKSFHSTTYLRQHVRRIHEKSPDFACETCGLDFASKATLISHIENIHEKVGDEYKCNICRKKFSREVCLERHMISIHIASKECKCNACDYVATTVSEVNEHIKRFHLNMRNHACNYCKFTSYTKGDLDIHNNSCHRELHQNNQFKCMKCERRFKRRFCLVQHVRIHST